MKHFYVINWNCNRNKFEPYDVIPYLVRTYKERLDRYDDAVSDYEKAKTEQEVDIAKSAMDYWEPPRNFDQFKEFVKKESQYQFWARCEYEIILVDWPCQKHEEKWDVYQQIMMNLNTVTRLLMESV